MHHTHCIQCGEELPPPSRVGRRRKFCPGNECARLYHNNKCAERAGRDPAAIKRRKPRARLPRSEVCLQCGRSLTGKQQRFCSQEHAYQWQAAQRNKGVQETYHWLSDIDEIGRTATCSVCGPGTKIYSAGTRRKVDGGRAWKCRIKEQRWADSAREHGWRRRGIAFTTEEFAQMLLDQEGCCAICLREFGDSSPHVDHCHDGGHVRGLLCSPCNTGLGQFGDSPDRLLAAIAYVERDRQTA